jgi:cyclopropane fatty-acyl-phospholipid synthase-like methyltransferase
MDNINNIYFDGYYKDIWRSLIPEELTIKETDFIFQYFDLKPGCKVLDLMCGYGRHAISIAKKGVEVTAVDNLEDYTNEISVTAKKENLPLKVIKTDILRFKSNETFDLAICMGNSLNFFNREEVMQLLFAVYSTLKEKGALLINTWSLAEIAIKQFTAKSWSTANGLKFLFDSKYLFQPTRIETDTIMISPDGKTETKKAIDYIFSIAEMEAILGQSGFSIKDIYSIPGKKRFALGEPRAYIVAKRK